MRVFYLLAFVLAALPAAAQSGSGLETRLTSDHASYAAGEPFTLTVTLFNPTDAPISSAFGSANCPVAIRFPGLGGDAWDGRVGPPVCVTAEQPFTLAPGAGLAWDFALEPDEDGVPFVANSVVEAGAAALALDAPVARGGRIAFALPTGTTPIVVEDVRLALGASLLPAADDGRPFTHAWRLSNTTVLDALTLMRADARFLGAAWYIDFPDYTDSYAVAQEAGVPAGVAGLSAPLPNPFDAAAAFTVTVTRAERVRVEAFDVLGRRVALLHDGRLAPGTAHPFRLRGAGLAPGLYLVRADGETFRQTRRVTHR